MLSSCKFAVFVRYSLPWTRAAYCAARGARSEGLPAKALVSGPA